MPWHIQPERVLFKRDPMLYGHFLEHFHRQVYGGVFMPGHPLSDENGFRKDVMEAMRRIRTPVIRWPGGCFVSAYHWEKGVGERVPVWDKAWRVEDDNSFGTDEFVRFCRLIGCEPYICLNAGTGSEEEMSNWLEYCNLDHEGEYARKRIANGHREPYNVKYWSIGNENYGDWEIGARDAQSWARLVTETSKMMKRVDPEAELSAAALTDINWNVSLLSMAAQRLEWISIHSYWDFMGPDHINATYEECMAFTHKIDHSVNEVRGILAALKLDDKIKIAFDEWNLRSWHHPKVHSYPLGVGKDSYLTPRDKNDDNSIYTMADAVFSACFLNAMNRHCDVVGMANFAPIVNTRGCIYSHDKGIVLRSTYHVFDLFVNQMGDRVVDLWQEGDMPTLTVPHKYGGERTVDALDILATTFTHKPGMAISAVNKSPDQAETISIPLATPGKITLFTLNGDSKDAYNDVDHQGVQVVETDLGTHADSVTITLEPHSVNVIRID